MTFKLIRIYGARAANDALIALAAFIAAAVAVVTQPFSWWIGDPIGRDILFLAPVYAAAMAAVFLLGKLHVRPWRSVSARDVGHILRLSAIGALLFLTMSFLTNRAEDLPRSVLILAWALTAGGMAGMRLMARAKSEGWLLDVLAPFRMRRDDNDKTAIILVGFSARVQRALLDIQDTGAPYQPIGVVLEDFASPEPITGARVLGKTPDLHGIVDMLVNRERRKLSIVFVDPPTRLPGVSEAALARLRRMDAPILRMPKVTELTEQERGSLQFRRVRLEEFLSRPPVDLSNPAFVQSVRGRRVLVTGAGGSIGAELCRQLAALGCGRLIMADIAETPLFEIDREIGANYPSLSRRAALCDVRDAAAIADLVAQERPDRIFHAAALKHVSLMETHPAAAILTNLLGTANVARAACRHGVGQMVLLSTDKAVNPSSVMGATKRLAEALVRELNAKGESRTRFSVVRFGNVLNSNGSAVPIFRRQIAAGGPVTVTHDQVERYFMTIPEAVQLVLHAAEMAETRQERDPGVFVLEMGDPVRIMDMARRMIDLLAPPGMEATIGIKMIGLQPGEKLSEELVDEDEETIFSTEGVLEVRSRHLAPFSIEDAEALGRSCQEASPDQLRDRLFETVERVRGKAAPEPGRPAHLQIVQGGEAGRRA